MSSRISSVPENIHWKRAYMAAVLEKDRTHVPRLIQEAKDSLSERLHELSSAGLVPNEEVKAIHDALYLLEALLSSLLYRDETAEWTAVTSRQLNQRRD